MLYGTAPSEILEKAKSIQYYGVGKGSAECEVPIAVTSLLTSSGNAVIRNPGASPATCTLIKKGQFVVVAVGGPANMYQRRFDLQPTLGDQIFFTLIDGRQVPYRVTTSRNATVWESEFSGTNCVR